MLMGPTVEHRCHVAQRAEKIELNHQATYCLTGGYAACARLARMNAEPVTLPANQPGQANAPGLDHS